MTSRTWNVQVDPVPGRTALTWLHVPEVEPSPFMVTFVTGVQVGVPAVSEFELEV